MQFITLFLLLIINLSGLFIYFASQFTKQEINGYLWSWLEINFEPSQFSSVAVLLFLAAQLLLIIIVYFYGVYNRRVYSKMNKFKRKSKDLATEQSQTKGLLKTQAKDLAAAESVEQKNNVLTQSNTQLQTVVSEQEKHIAQLERSLHTLEKSVATAGKPTIMQQLRNGVDAVKKSFKK